MIRNNKGITLIALIVTIVVLLILAGVAIQGGIQGIDEVSNDKLTSELEMVQHAVLERYTKYKLTKNANLLVGTQVDTSTLTDVPSGIEWKVTDAEDLTNPEKKYYRLSKTDLNDLGLASEKSTNASYIVNYYTGEVYNETNKTTSDNKVLYTTS